MPGLMSDIHGFLCLRAVMRVSPPSCPASPLRATVAWQYAFADVTPSAALAFQGTGTAFSVAGVPIARNSALVDAGFDWRFATQAKLGLSYLGELTAHAQTHAVKGSFTWDF